jgi:hypothetical protein
MSLRLGGSLALPSHAYIAEPKMVGSRLERGICVLQ